ncbi:MAG: energy transducer TonB [Candidatus Sulfotelmatobacter sp.]
MNLRVFLTVACLALPSASFAQSAAAPGAHSEDVQTRAETLLDKARQLSDIRSPNAPAFRLKATFSFIGKDLETVQGTYSEVWVSNSQWSRETVVKDSRRVEVGGATRMWQLDNTEDFPEQAAQLPGLMNIFPPKSASFAFESIADQAEVDPPAECAITKLYLRHRKFAFCFDKKSGALLEKSFPETRPMNSVDISCNYGLFHKFGDRWFPREMACSEDRHKKIEANIAELSVEPSPDPALFTPPPGAIEIGTCSVATFTPNPKSRFGFRDEASAVSVMLSLVVDTKGKAQNVRVLRPGSKNYDKSALETVRRWRFQPGTCNGDPMPLQIRVEVDFRLYR